jgi:hypothetical protein
MVNIPNSKNKYLYIVLYLYSIMSIFNLVTNLSIKQMMTGIIRITFDDSCPNDSYSLSY